MVYGVLINIVDHESGRVEVLWESDGKTSMTYLNKLHLESQQTLDVTSSSVSSSVSYSAAVLPDSCTTDSVPDKPLYELLYKGKVIFHGEQVTEAHATVAHGTKLAKTEYKFLIKKVLNSHLFDNYDEDMTQGSYIRWPPKKHSSAYFKSMACSSSSSRSTIGDFRQSYSGWILRSDVTDKKEKEG